jgi:hypothetical protein
MVVMRVIKSPFSFLPYLREFFLTLYQRKVTTDLIIASENKFRETGGQGKSGDGREVSFDLIESHQAAIRA